MNPWWALEDPSVNGPDEGESSTDDLATCDICGNEYGVWTDPEDGRETTWCCQPCYYKGESE
jgi:hypothetical protein